MDQGSWIIIPVLGGLPDPEVQQARAQNKKPGFKKPGLTKR